MPELPEVETFIRELAPELNGRRITRPRLLARRHRLSHRRGICDGHSRCAFDRFERRGKYMLFGLDDPRTLIVHLRMTGKLQLAPAAGPPAKHEHVILDLDDGRNLHYQDPRKFGRFWLTPTPETVLAKLGPEPLGPDFTPAYLIDKLAGRKAPIKALLLDQRIVAGIGNIYADETLYRHTYTRRGPPATCAQTRSLGCTPLRRTCCKSPSNAAAAAGRSNLQNYIRPGGEQEAFKRNTTSSAKPGSPARIAAIPSSAWSSPSAAATTAPSASRTRANLLPSRLRGLGLLGRL